MGMNHLIVHDRIDFPSISSLFRIPNDLLTCAFFNPGSLPYLIYSGSYHLSGIGKSSQLIINSGAYLLILLVILIKSH